MDFQQGGEIRSLIDFQQGGEIKIVMGLHSKVGREGAPWASSKEGR
jgi:hypothetical protein